MNGFFHLICASNLTYCLRPFSSSRKRFFHLPILAPDRAATHGSSVTNLFTCKAHPLVAIFSSVPLLFTPNFAAT
jgi:hypothetical protein